MGLLTQRRLKMLGLVFPSLFLTTGARATPFLPMEITYPPEEGTAGPPPASQAPPPPCAEPSTPQTGPENSRWTLVETLRACLEQSGAAPPLDPISSSNPHAHIPAETQIISERVAALSAQLALLEDQQFSTTTKLTSLTILGLKTGDSLTPRPAFIRSLDRSTPTQSQTSALGAVFFSLNTSFSGRDVLKTTLYSSNQAQEFFSQSQLGNSPSNRGIDTFFPPSRTVWSLIPNSFSLYRLSYQFPATRDLSITVGSKFYPTDIIDTNSFTHPINTYNSWSMVNNLLLTPYSIRLLGGAGAGFDWRINQGPVSVRGVYIARRGGEAGSSSPNASGGLFAPPYQGSAELEFSERWSSSNSLTLRLQYTHSDSSGIEQDVLGVNAEVLLGKVGLFGRYGHAWAIADPGINPLPFGDGDAGSFRAQLFQAGVAVQDLGIERSLFSAAISQPFITNLRPAPGILPRAQTNLEAFYRIPLSANLYLTPTLMTIFNPNNRADQPSLVQGFLRLTFLY